MKHMGWSHADLMATPTFYVDVLMDLLEEEARKRSREEALGLRRRR